MLPRRQRRSASTSGRLITAAAVLLVTLASVPAIVPVHSETAAGLGDTDVVNQDTTTRHISSSRPDGNEERIKDLWHKDPGIERRRRMKSSKKSSSESRRRSSSSESKSKRTKSSSSESKRSRSKILDIFDIGKGKGKGFGPYHTGNDDDQHQEKPHDDNILDRGKGGKGGSMTKKSMSRRERCHHMSRFMCPRCQKLSESMYRSGKCRKMSQCAMKYFRACLRRKERRYAKFRCSSGTANTSKSSSRDRRKGRRISALLGSEIDLSQCTVPEAINQIVPPPPPTPMPSPAPTSCSELEPQDFYFELEWEMEGFCGDEDGVVNLQTEERSALEQGHLSYLNELETFLSCEEEGETIIGECGEDYVYEAISIDEWIPLEACTDDDGSGRTLRQENGRELLKRKKGRGKAKGRGNCRRCRKKKKRRDLGFLDLSAFGLQAITFKEGFRSNTICDDIEEPDLAQEFRQTQFPALQNVTVAVIEDIDEDVDCSLGSLACAESNACCGAEECFCDNPSASYCSIDDESFCLLRDEFGENICCNIDPVSGSLLYPFCSNTCGVPTAPPSPSPPPTTCTDIEPQEFYWTATFNMTTFCTNEDGLAGLQFEESRALERGLLSYFNKREACFAVLEGDDLDECGVDNEFISATIEEFIPAEICGDLSTTGRRRLRRRKYSKGRASGSGRCRKCKKRGTKNKDDRRRMLKDVIWDLDLGEIDFLGLSRMISVSSDDSRRLQTLDIICPKQPDLAGEFVATGYQGFENVTDSSVEKFEDDVECASGQDECDIQNTCCGASPDCLCEIASESRCVVGTDGDSCTLQDDGGVNLCCQSDPEVPELLLYPICNEECGVTSSPTTSPSSAGSCSLQVCQILKKCLDGRTDATTLGICVAQVQFRCNARLCDAIGVDIFDAAGEPTLDPTTNPSESCCGGFDLAGNLYGKFAGTVDQSNAGTYPVEITYTEAGIVTIYQTLSCGNTEPIQLGLNSVRKGFLTWTERIEFGSRCINGGTVTLAQLEESSRWNYRWTGGFRVSAVGELEFSCNTNCGEGAQPTPAITQAPTQTSNPPVSTDDVRAAAMLNQLSTVTDRDILSSRGTAENDAYRWITFEDERQLDPEDPTLVQRYIMALLYFATQGGTWRQCSAGSDSINCRNSSDSPPGTAFLSEASECTWGYWEEDSCNDLGEIKVIRITNNNLRGTLPIEVTAALPALQTLDLRRNRLFGRLPNTWSDGLTEIILSRNNFSGPVSGNFPAGLRVFVVSENSLSGGLDNDAGLKYKDLVRLELQNNEFFGTFPASVGDITSLEVVNIQGNSITGIMPAEVCENRGTISAFQTLIADCPPQFRCGCCSNNCGSSSDLPSLSPVMQAPTAQPVQPPDQCPSATTTYFDAGNIACIGGCCINPDSSNAACAFSAFSEYSETFIGQGRIISFNINTPANDPIQVQDGCRISCTEECAFVAAASTIAPSPSPAPIVLDSRFGEAVSIQGNIAVVGAPNANRTYVFERTVNGWEENLILRPSDIQAMVSFGNSVAIDGDLIVVGGVAARRDGSDVVTAALVYKKDGESWQEEAVLEIPAPEGQVFGSLIQAVDIIQEFADESTIVIGSRRHDAAGSASGAAFVFVQTDSTPTTYGLQAVLQPEDLSLNHGFGASIAIDGSTIAVGSPGDSGNGLSNGAVYVFNRESGSGEWPLDTKLYYTSESTSTASFFGTSVSLSGNYLVGGAMNGNAAYFFALDSDGNWIQESEVIAPIGDRVTGSNFGATVAIWTDSDVAGREYAVIGAPAFSRFADDIRGGAAFIYKRAEDGGNGEWILDRRLVPDGDDVGCSRGPGCGFALSVSIDKIGGQNIAVGSPLENGSTFIIENCDVTTVNPTCSQELLLPTSSSNPTTPTRDPTMRPPKTTNKSKSRRRMMRPQTNR